ncbi:hypothetical protein QYH69_15745 [Paraburkholderia sp. SARCC-3016]|uniref:hypothetical protein n=1 Tax=Paraburkholderia sp. SARCC-3016 TaxID=3058611 RepID=UPI00280851B5|nr:hypothetical protein [Paraburkholderia sp. SARCC-3016]MDQ7978704.1 hypothetical protein [Paraburkholderia sp. SARCC-3016]
MRMVDAFAWTVPAFFQNNVVDHTWVTTYDNQQDSFSKIDDVVHAGEHYWYCWGDFHVTGGTQKHPHGLLLRVSIDLSLAKCLVAPDLETKPNRPAQGTIFAYGIDGVCHQLANQVLYSSETNGRPPAIVKTARGFRFSQFLFGNYGLQAVAWKQRAAKCGSDVGGSKMSDDDDDFAAHLRDAVTGPDRAEKIAKLLAARERFHSVTLTKKFEHPTADELNRMYSSFLHEAADILGNADFEKVFGEPVSDEMAIVDPAIYEQSLGH